MKMKALVFGSVYLFYASSLLAQGSGAQTLLAMRGSARPAALGEAYTAAINDISALGFNPACLNTLQRSQLSFNYQQGLVDDAFGDLKLGIPTRRGGFGLAFGYYNGGKIDLYNGTAVNSVNAQTDYSIGMGYAHGFGPLSLGVTGKYLSSKLIDQYSAQTYAFDAGGNFAIGSRLNLGAAVQNVGSKITYLEVGNELPKMAVVALRYKAVQAADYSATLLIDAPYLINEQETQLGTGLEVLVGPLAIRGGYKVGNDVQNLSLGAGFSLGQFTLDYAIGLVDNLESRHKVSLTMAFGGKPEEPVFVRKHLEKKDVPQEVVNNKPQRKHTLKEAVTGRNIERRRRVYVVKTGDTLGDIAQREYGNRKLWVNIYSANKHLISDPTTIEAGQKIVLPE